MNNLTEEEAKTKFCPVDGLESYCVASGCAAWRWQPLMMDAAFIEAAKKAAIEIGDKTPSRSKAVKRVEKNRAKYGLPVKPYRGRCGLAGPA